MIAATHCEGPHAAGGVYRGRTPARCAEFKALQVPKVGVKAAVLVQDANAMAEAAKPYQQVFVGNGRPETFLDDLVAAAVRASIDARGKSIATKAAARVGLKATATRAHAALRFVDAQVKSAAADDAKILAAWQSAKRIGKGKVVPIEATIPAPANSSPAVQQAAA